MFRCPPEFRKLLIIPLVADDFGSDDVLADSLCLCNLQPGPRQRIWFELPTLSV